MFLLDEYIEKDHFPIKIENKIGEKLKKEFISLNTYEIGVKEGKKRYKLKYKNNIYVLLEEYLFDEEDFFIDYKKVIGKNFYLSRI